MVTPCSTIVFAGPRQFAVAPAFGGEVHDHRTWRHALHHIGGDEQWRFLAGNHRRGDDHVAFDHDFSEQFALAIVEILILRLGISSRVLRIGGFDGQFDKAAAQALHLFLGSGTQIICRSHRSQSASGRDGLQAGDARSQSPNTRAGVIVPAAVVSMGKMRGRVSAAINTAL